MTKNKTTVKTNVTLDELYSAKKSISGRLRRLRRTRHLWTETKSPIEEIGVFGSEIDSMEETLRNMRDRLNGAKITIEI